MGARPVALISFSRRIANASVAAESAESTSTVIDKDQTFVVDEPVALGGKGAVNLSSSLPAFQHKQNFRGMTIYCHSGTGPSPLAHFLGSLIGCTQITLRTIADEQKANVDLVAFCLMHSPASLP